MAMRGGLITDRGSGPDCDPAVVAGVKAPRGKMHDQILTRLRRLVAPKPVVSSTRRAFVVGAYLPNGGTYMAYHLGRILNLDFGLEIVVVTVGDESVDNGIFHYNVRYPT